MNASTRIFGICVPIGWVVEDVCANSFEVSIVADDVFMIIALPRETLAIDFARRSGHRRLERANDHGQCSAVRRYDRHSVIGIAGRFVIRRGVQLNAPTRIAVTVGDNQNNAMYVIGHNDKFVQFDIGMMRRHGNPTFGGNLTDFVQPHFTLDDLAERAFAVVRHNRHEIGACLGIVVTLQSD